MKLAKKVLQYWHLIETLSPNGFPEVKDNILSKSVRFGKYLNKNNSWLEVSASDELREKFPILYEQSDYCVGKVSKEALISSFFEKINKRNPSIEEEEGDLCLFGFITSGEDEEYIKGSFRISPFIWSINKLISKQSIKVSGYKEECNNSEYINILESDDSIKKRIEELFIKLKEKYLAFIADSSSINMDVAVFWSRFKDVSEKEIKSEKLQHESSFMSSFLLSDLEMVLENYERNQLLKEYIEVLNMSHSNKTDIKKEIDKVNDILSADYMPRAKWPGKFAPALMQQIAINYSCKGENPLLSVNGPPGTGKTTLLKEIIAQKVYEFALAISEYDTPDQAFIESEFPQKNDVFKKWYKPAASISKYGILVCSCNNSAVENISLELPDLDELKNSIDGRPYKDFFEKKDIYYTESATKLLRKKTKSENCNAWGLISAPLGKSENIFDVVTSISNEIKYRKNKDIEEKQKNNLFKEAKEEFLEQKKKVESKINEYSSCITNDYLGRLQTGDETCQYENPWAIEALDVEREILFIKALNLRKEFLQSSRFVRDNIKILFHFWGYRDQDAQDINFSEDTKYEIYNDLFQTLSMVIPVISTTFASVGTFLRYINEPEKIGLLIVDEAGQATPQNMVGVLYRSKHAVVVGDPLQVEPVVTVPKYFNEIISDYELDQYFSQKESVQTFADRMNPIGSYISNENTDSGKLWVGCPLLVHRRCLEPMFSISNRLSYDSTMINQTKKDNKFEKVAMFDKSYWFNIKGEDKGKNHSVEEQAQFVVNVIKNKKAENEKYKVYVISPFSTVVKRINALLKENDIKDIDCGTVHKFQGKQAEEVFFVLGCSLKTKGAVNWVNANIVNVAVTRAKFRLYIVGDRELWLGNRNFEIAQELLLNGPIDYKTRDISLQKRINSVIESLFSNDEYNICITDSMYLIKRGRKCWDKACALENPVYAIAANRFVMKNETDLQLFFSQNSFTIFKNITKCDEFFETILNAYEVLHFDKKLGYYANHCSCGRYQKEEYLFSKEDKNASFYPDITKENFEIIPIKLSQDIFIKAEIYKNFLFDD
ncbi:MAG: hypothetical protein E7064_04290 [Spirochaetaceae bacterium]|nr:hypothetical protein [Spirochaetaceae bacterium]